MASAGVGTTALRSLYIGIDVGTSGCRAVAIDDNSNIAAQASIALPDSQYKDGHIVQQAHDWWLACHLVLDNLLAQVPRVQVRAISIDATSGSVLLCDNDGTVFSDAYMYNDKNNVEEAALIKQTAPDNCAAHGPSSGLAKCLSLLQQYTPPETAKCFNQADWLAGVLTQQYNYSDQNNSLKLGYDAVNQQWPEWLHDLDCYNHFAEKVYAPGEKFAPIAPQIAKTFGLSKTTQIVAGTTDSIAAFVATGANKLGDAVTSLGSTLAVKVIADKPIYAPEFGIYSHRLGDLWLVGGASNTGGAVLKKYFTADQINMLSTQLQPNKSTELDYYPLLDDGERFPINDHTLKPKLDPRPINDLEFFQGILEGIANIEKTAYEKLAELGAPYPTQIISMGGGSVNTAWQEIRQNKLGVPVKAAKISEAAYGSALLARQGINPARYQPNRALTQKNKE